jgi:hypothetical protein
LYVFHHLTLLLSVPSVISANLLAAQVDIRINLLQNLLQNLPNFFYSSFNRHISTPCMIFDSHTISYIYIYRSIYMCVYIHIPLSVFLCWGY